MLLLKSCPGDYASAGLLWSLHGIHQGNLQSTALVVFFPSLAHACAYTVNNFFSLIVHWEWWWWSHSFPCGCTLLRQDHYRTSGEMDRTPRSWTWSWTGVLAESGQEEASVKMCEYDTCDAGKAERWTVVDFGVFFSLGLSHHSPSWILAEEMVPSSTGEAEKAWHTYLGGCLAAWVLAQDSLSITCSRNFESGNEWCNPVFREIPASRNIHKPLAPLEWEPGYNFGHLASLVSTCFLRVVF